MSDEKTVVLEVNLRPAELALLRRIAHESCTCGRCDTPVGALVYEILASFVALKRRGSVTIHSKCKPANVGNC